MQQINKNNYTRNITNIYNIAKLLEIDIDEPFQIQFFTHKNPFESTWYKLTENGLMYSYSKEGNYNCKSNALEGLLIGKHQIVKYSEM